MSTIALQEQAAVPLAIILLPIIGVIFAGYFVIGIAMPVLPLHVHQGLGFGTFIVGTVAGSQFGASLISRFTAGQLADVRGAKRAVVRGLLAGGAAGLLYLLLLAFRGSPGASLTILLLGRAVLGGAESFMVACALNWGIALGSAKNTGKVMSWVGTAMYVAYAVGAPVGSALYARYGFLRSRSRRPWSRCSRCCLSLRCNRSPDRRLHGRDPAQFFAQSGSLA